MKQLLRSFPILLVGVLVLSGALAAQDPRDQTDSQARSLQGAPAESHSGNSPFEPPEKNDATFVVDQAPGLDTGCTFRSGGPLVFDIPVGRVVGPGDPKDAVAKLRANGLIGDTARLQMPAFDVDFDANIPDINPERDRVSFNGKVVPTEFLTGSNGVWKLNSFNVPIDWVKFPADPRAGGEAQEVANTISIEIDVANDDEYWCTAIDWASLEIEVVRPVVMAHGILSDGGVWDAVWVPQLNNLGIPNDNDLDMGNLDSIANNAAKIADAVERNKKRWGVDRVNLVCHSKGGLDSRHYAENDDSVDQILQLGTPNAGSPLADAVQVGSAVLLGLGNTVLINKLAGPAGVQLTTPYMSLYNRSHGSNPKVRYTALAGDYDPDCSFFNPFCRPLERILLLITGAGDTIVPITSVHALGYTNNRIFASSGANKDATHTALEKAIAVFNATRDVVQRPGRPKALLQTPVYANTGTVGGEIVQGTTETHVVPVDETGPTFFTLTYPAGELELVLISPSGERYDPARAAVDPDVEYDVGEILGGQMAAYSLDVTEVGLWTVEVSALALDDPAAGYAVHAWIEDPAVRFVGSLGDEAVPAGATLELFGTVRESGVPLLGAAVVARVVGPDDAVTDVSLVDDGTGIDATAGDGIYSGPFATSLSGFYRVAFTASGTNSAGAAFSREGFGLAAVSAGSSSFAGTFGDFGRDTDGDGFFNELVVTTDLDIDPAGEYRVFGILTDAAGNDYEARVTGLLGIGPATVELRFDGEAIFQSRVDGPYTLSRVVLVEEDDFLVLPVDELTDGHTTAAYSYLDFQHGPIELTGQGSANGIDLDSNALYDLLAVAVEAEVDRSGFYQWSAQLVDTDGTEVGFDSGAAFFSAGTVDLTFTFDGGAIGENGVDGPYVVTSLLVFGGAADLVANDVFQTPPFLASEFEGFTADTTPPVIELSVDPTVLWPPRHQLVEITATLAVSDDLDPDPEVRLVSIVSSEADNSTGDGNTDDDIQDEIIGTDDRQFLLRAERSGQGEGRVYTITYEAEDAAGNVSVATATVTVPHNLGGR